MRTNVDKNLLREQIKNGVDVPKSCSLGKRTTYLSGLREKRKSK